jgi:hypothetical protein
MSSRNFENIDIRPVFKPRRRLANFIHAEPRSPLPPTRSRCWPLDNGLTCVG